MTLDKSFQAWRGRGPTDSSEVIRRFLINQQDRDPQVREAKEVLESSLDPSSFKANLPPSLYHYIQHCVLFNGVLCKVELWDEDEALKIVLPRPAVSSLLNELGSYYHHIRGHVGVDATYRHVRKLFWAPALRKSIKSVVRSCAACLVTTPAKKLRHESHLRCPSAPFEVIGCDLGVTLSPFPLMRSAHTTLVGTLPYQFVTHLREASTKCPIYTWPEVYAVPYKDEILVHGLNY
ncbi:hypothetical protein FOZ62_004747 [Perkinsus olseni]|uniref:Integrase zinc-binding domain-containing protein n=1 Tax=Perkinsus olseni TaxID=32597 RepID=A0A7J6U5X7_PEROL|nr:hypothetical protein FOZ62_004747 [Perkinsus olseni]